MTPLRRGANILVNGCLVMASLALTFGVFEVVARLSRGRPGEPIAAQYTMHDPLLGWRHRPGTRVDFPQGPYVINARGLRDREREWGAPGGVERLLVLGDSFAEGFSVRLEDAVSQVLERTLDRPACRHEVINGGTVGYSTDQEYLFYKEEGFRYGARVVVLFFYYNDILYNGREGVGRTPKPLFTFAGGTPRVRNHPVPEAAPFQTTAAVSSPAKGSAAVDWARRRLLSAAPRAYNRLGAVGLWPPITPAEPGVELQAYSRNPPRAVEQAWEFTVHLLRLLGREVQARGARLLVAYVPSKMEVSERDWELTRLRYHGVNEESWDRGRVVRLLQRAGRAAGIPVLDLTEALKKEDRGLFGGPYHAQGGHWNAVGHRVAAREAVARLRAEGWLTPCTVETKSKDD